MRRSHPGTQLVITVVAMSHQVENRGPCAVIVWTKHEHGEPKEFEHRIEAGESIVLSSHVIRYQVQPL